MKETRAINILHLLFPFSSLLFLLPIKRDEIKQIILSTRSAHDVDNFSFAN